MTAKRPKFKDIRSFQEFNQYYWYRNELSQICKGLKLEYRGTKQELTNIIKEYFSGNLISKQSVKKYSKTSSSLTKESSLLECGFSFNSRFREYFSNLTGISPFIFTADMAAVWRKVQRDGDKSITIQDMLDTYYERTDYTKYDHSSCQWNQFYKDFCAYKNSSVYAHKMKVASILWKEVKESKKEKVYSTELLNVYHDRLKDYVTTTISS